MVEMKKFARSTNTHSQWGSHGIRRGDKDSKDGLIGHIMTIFITANDNTFEAKGDNVVSFAKAKAARTAPMAVEGLRLAA